MKSKSFLLLLFAYTISMVDLNAQFVVDADLRSRFEYRHGFNNLFPNDADPAAFVAQRSRLNIGYNNEMFKIFISVQDVSTWGDTRQILPIDGNDSFSLFQAWGQVYLNEHWSLKAGRQVLSYDDQRIFGGLDWAMQGRFHDAALIKYSKNGFSTDLGFAFSQEGQSNEGTVYNIQGFFTYKAMQYAHFNKSWENNSVSFLLLNTGFQKFTGPNSDIPDGVYYRHTAGSYFKFPWNNINLAGSAYYQFGKANATTDLSAYQASLEAGYKPNKTLYAIGIEVLSGTNQDGESKNKSFFPLYGTNHKFNGFMDYFYVGNHANNIGLNDLYAKMVCSTGEKSTLLVKAHYFAANANLTNNSDKYLGTELDLVYTQNVGKGIKFNLGYSHMFAAESMSFIKGGRPHDNTNNWAWAQLIINPRLLQMDLKNPEKI
ncbi:alginate export family protein [Flagellimonas myxillae]|uniref:alginate export family protein n=1 Tax=Flagellimonas myxillae TaxID=2942214 RepID=UPI00201EC64A|nr:alginate export family protein [Muricauda myxillae]MCL6265440.1 alginate export family protein [Muricauda myxillae]